MPHTENHHRVRIPDYSATPFALLEYSTSFSPCTPSATYSRREYTKPCHRPPIAALPQRAGATGPPEGVGHDDEDHHDAIALRRDAPLTGAVRYPQTQAPGGRGIIGVTFCTVVSNAEALDWLSSGASN
jgi:hypothetical protein